MKGPAFVNTESNVRTIAFLGDYLPRKCGIATFTSDLLGAVSASYPLSCCFAVPVTDIKGCYRYPAVVRFEIDEQDLGSYLGAADFLNTIRVDAVSVQHEFGIFGGPAGSHLLPLLRELNAPIVTTLHTVLVKPNADQNRVMRGLIALSARLVVMTERGRTILQEVYQAPPAKIDIIPHGIPDVPLFASDHYKDQFGVGERRVLLTFGLLSPNKGIENVLNALHGVAVEFPDVVYLVVGATHPNELRSRGETYRLSLEAIVAKHQLENNVIFVNRFVDLKELTSFIGAADLYITPYLEEAQITSGTLAYAFGAGKVVISTPYWHAAELLREQRGVLVPFADPKAIAREVSALLRDGPRRSSMSDNAYNLGRGMVWSKTAGRYMRSFELARHQGTSLQRRCVTASRSAGRLHESPKLNLDHLYHLAGSAAGSLQHANFPAPNHSEGHCTDDDGRALILTVLLCQLEETPERVLELAQAYAALLYDACDPTIERRHSFGSVDRVWLDERGSDDRHGRAIWTLGIPAGLWQNRTSQMSPERLLAQALPDVGFPSPRPWAPSLLDVHEYLFRVNSDRLAKAVGQPTAADRDIHALRWRVGAQAYPQGRLRRVGSNRFNRRNAAPADFDQSIETRTFVSLCQDPYRATACSRRNGEARRACSWLLGWNDLGLGLHCLEIRGWLDGLRASRGSENQGESLLAFLLSLAEMRLVQSFSTRLQPTGLGAPITH